ncbi:hypothetical protein KVR01_004513 [Diaporthe batatas]|uniref:uncharacterized protein n=1 Tax=Diaporthe batatas TaxID=748121 RepID=UPI001D054AF9|nr:uncharacterized protein KVR01_004513 [Diaporthe batatas]KAG8165961.1 hypothetical protein KVR01_004513 [Diaporthe batatas]
MAAPLQLSLRDSDPWAVAKQAFDLISDYVQPDSSVSPGDIAQQLNSLTPGQRVLQDGENAEEPVSFLLEFWETLVCIARQIPYDHPSQERMVKLMASLDELSSQSTEAASNGSGSIWRYFNELSNVLDDTWNEPTEMEDSFEPFQEWVNLNSFVARLFGDGLIDWDNYACWTLRDSLEAQDATTKDLRESRLAAATQWFTHAALALFKVMREKTATESNHMYLRSPVFSGDKVISLERWNFWKEQLQKVQGKDTGPEQKQIASQAVGAMDDAEARYGQG